MADTALTSAYYDVHAHLVDNLFSNDLSDVLSRAKADGLKGVLAVSENLEEAERILELSRSNPGFVWACAGMHPEKASRESLPAMLQFIRENKDQLTAVGEVGLDYSPHVLGSSDPEGVKAVQRDCLIRQAELARDLGLPLNLHSRSAGHHVIQVLKDLQIKDAVLHAFDGKPHYAEDGAKHGYYFSVPPSIVRSPQKQKMVKRLPIECLLLETDSPVLGPEKDKRNEPCNVAVACKAIAEIKGMKVEDVARITGENTRKLFRK